MTLSPAQLAYLAAFAQVQEVRAASAVNDAIFDAAYEAAGEPDDFRGFYASWAAANPADAAEAQRLCELHNAAATVLRAAEDTLLGWCYDVVAAIATEAQRANLARVRDTKHPIHREKAIALAMKLGV